MRHLVALLLALTPALTTARADQTLDEKIALCASCHGEDGKPVEADYPIISGQHYYYLYTQLRDYAAGRRANEIMQGIVADLTKEDMQALAQYFSEKPWPRLSVPMPSEADQKRAETMAGAAECSACHLAGFVGNSRVPRVSSQLPAYLERTITDFRNKVRNNAPDKGALFRTFDVADIAAMAHYLAALQPPPSAGGG
jgi:cytochrome c553